MKPRRRALTLLAVLCLAAGALGSTLSFEGHAAVRESLARVPAKFRAEWLIKRGLDASRYAEYRRPETTGLRLVGKYGRGPSNEVTGRGNLVALTLGSEVALFCGTRGDTSRHYNMDVHDAQTDDLIAHRHDVASAGDHAWLRFTSIVNDGKFVRGREYVARFTRPNADLDFRSSDLTISQRS